MNAQIVLDKVGVRFPGRVLFSEINWTLYEGMRVALAGRNGCGKSTLLKILSGRMEPPEGKRNSVGGKNLRIGFLDQSLLDSQVVEASQMKDKGASPVSFLKTRLPVDEDNEFEDREWEIRKILEGLGFSKEWMDGPLHQLSGGWLLRVFVAETLLQKPDVLLLDEPTNHLDISSIQWLEEFLENEYTGSLILVTHDVALQRRTTDSLAIVHGGKFYFRTHFSDYLSFRESLGEEKRLLEKSIESLEKKIEENMEFVFKFRAKAQTAARAQSKLKAAEELQAEKRALQDQLLRIQGNTYNMNFRFRLSGPGGKFPISTKNLSFKYSENGPQILNNLSFDIRRGERVAIIGDNGTGKTTLLNIIAERLTPTSGELTKAHAVETGYFGQHQLDELMLDESVLDNLRSQSRECSFEELRGWLGAFGFSTQDEIDKKAKVLSGGERARLALLRILVTRINLCLLDEPTNHLDVETKALLKNSIKDFEGTTIFVSHDRDFVADLAERILYLTHDHRLIDHMGNLDSFFEKYPEFVRHLEGKAKPSAAPVSAAPKETPKGIPKLTLSYEERKKVRNLLKSLDKKIQTSEEAISKLGAEKDNLHKQVTDPNFMNSKSDAERNAIYAELTKTEETLHKTMVDWERWTTEMENLKKQVE